MSRSALVDGLWGEDVPDSAVKMVHIYVSQLRKSLGEGVLKTRGRGYALVAGEAQSAVKARKLELTPEQAKIITVAQQMADRLTLALRSVAEPAHITT